MFKKENILILFGADSNLRWGRSFQLAKAFRSLGHNVLYIDGPKSIVTSLRLIYKNALQDVIVEGIDVFRPFFGLPYSRFVFLMTLNRCIVINQIIKKLNETYFKPSILWIYTPYDPEIGLFLKKKFNIQKVVYDCADDRVAYAHVHRGLKAANKVKMLEKKLCSYCTSLVTITENLKQNKKIRIRI